jgi:hypothetical protein
VGRIVEVVRTFIPSDRWPEVQAVLRGEAPIQERRDQETSGIEMVDVDDGSGDDGYY